MRRKLRTRQSRKDCAVLLERTASNVEGKSTDRNQQQVSSERIRGSGVAEEAEGVLTAATRLGLHVVRKDVHVGGKNYSRRFTASSDFRSV